jgi:hypothetical protein
MPIFLPVRYESKNPQVSGRDYRLGDTWRYRIRIGDAHESVQGGRPVRSAPYAIHSGDECGPLRHARDGRKHTGPPPVRYEGRPGAEVIWCYGAVQPLATWPIRTRCG